MRNLKKINVLISVFLLLLFSNFTQEKNSEEFSFDKLRCKKITFKDISLDDGVYDDRISFIEESFRVKKSKIYPVKLSNKYPLYHGCSDSIPIPENRHDNKDEYLQFYDTKININSLLKNNLNNEKVYNSDYVYILFTRSIDFFKFKGKDFILLSANDREFYRNLERNYWILLQIKNHDIINSFCFIDGYDGKDCFGDFNNDGLLDYMNWDFEKDKISLYSLRDDKFEIDKNHYIKVKQSKAGLELKNGRGYILIYDLFDRKNSKWFYKL